MGIEQSAFEPRALARMIEIRQRPVQWYADRYYRSAEGVHGSALVELDVRVGGKRMAPIQRPTETSRVMARESVSSQLIRLPYMKPARPTTAEEILKRRAPGTHLYAERDLVGEAQRQIGRDIEDLDDMIERRREYMAAQGVITGLTPIVALNENGVASIDAQVDWGMPAAHLVTLTGTGLWTDAASDPVANLRQWQQLIIGAANISATMATVGTSVGDAILKHAKLLALLDNRRVEAGQIELRAKAVEGITYLGRIAGVDIYEDARTYTDDAGVSQPITPVDRLVLGAQGENRWHHGPISDLKCTSPLVARWVKTWETEEPSQRHVAVHTRCLPALHQPGANVSAKVV